MASMAHDIQLILDSASQYSKDPTPAMLQREAAGRELAEHLRRELAAAAHVPGVAALHLDAKDGGRQAYFGPLAWVRVFSRDYAPTAQRGIYLVYLFAADGSRVYLSLNQGTSEFRSGHQRTVNDTRLLLSRAGQARAELGDLIEAEGAAGTTMSIDLGGHVIVSRDSLAKASAYEDANILAREYRSGQVPPDEQLVADLTGLLPMLARLYEQPLAPASIQDLSSSGAPSRPIAAAAGREQDTDLRKLVEDYAEQHADAYLTGLGWTVRHVGPLKLGYDLQCANSEGKALHVEVKGTRTRGEKVALTTGEVRHVREATECGATHALYVVSEIDVSPDRDAQCSGGKATCILPWVIDEADLVPTEYSYRVPPATPSDSSAGH